MDVSWQALFELVYDLLTRSGRAWAPVELASRLAGVFGPVSGVALFDMREGPPYCLAAPDYSHDAVIDFNSHYNRCIPFVPPAENSIIGPVDWSLYQGSEYNEDFNRPNKVGHSLGIRVAVNEADSDIAIVFSRPPERNVAFTAVEIKALSMFLDCLVATGLSRAATFPGIDGEIGCLEVSDGHRPLSPREAQIANLLSRRMPMRSIAALLGISPRTVERHVLHIYDKLGVHNRTELLSMLIGGRLGQAG